MRNVFVIPSWYPSSEDPVSGIFIKNQLEALSSLSTKYRPIVCLWGQGSENLPLRDIKGIPDWLWRYITEPREYRRCDNNVNVIYSRAFGWTHKIPFGGAMRLLSSCRNNLEKAIQIGKVDLIHAYVSYPAGFIASILSKEFGIPYVLTEFMGPFPFPVHLKSNGDVRKEIRLAVEKSAQNIVLSKYLRQCFENFSLPEPTVIPFSVNQDLFTYQKKNPSDDIVFVTCCRLVKEKGVYDLMHAFANALKVNANLKLKIIGSGPEDSGLKKLSIALGISERIDWKGEQKNTEVAKIMSSADIFILPSKFDTFGVAYVEAMASGLPIIATKCGGPEEFINKDIGLLVSVGDIESLSNAIIDMVNNIDRYNKEKIKKYCKDNFSEEIVIGKIEEIYDRVILENSNFS